MILSPKSPTNPTGSLRRVLAFVRCHFCVLLYSYFACGLMACALLAPDDRVVALDSALLGHGWHLAVLAAVLFVPVPTVYVWRWRTSH